MKILETTKNRINTIATTFAIVIDIVAFGLFADRVDSKSTFPVWSVKTAAKSRLLV